MRQWDDVRVCQVCGGEAVWEEVDARWVHVVAGADHVADVPVGGIAAVVERLDVAEVEMLLDAGWDVARVVAELQERAAAAAVPGRLCPGRCGHRWRLGLRWAVEEVVDAREQGRPVDVAAVRVPGWPRPGEPVWCAEDVERVLAAVRRLPDLTAMVNVRGDGRLNAGRSDADGRSASGAAAPSPSPAHDVVDAVVRWAVEEAEQLVGVRSGGGSREPSGAPLNLAWLTDAVRVLTGPRSAAWLGDLEQGHRAGREALRWVSDLERATGQDLLVHRLPVRCPQCQARALTRRNGTEEVECQRCAWKDSEGTYVALVQVAATERRERLRQERRAARCRAS